MEMPNEDQDEGGDKYKEEAEFVSFLFEFWVSVGVTEQADSTAPETNLVLRFGEWTVCTLIPREMFQKWGEGAGRLRAKQWQRLIRSPEVNICKKEEEKCF